MSSGLATLSQMLGQGHERQEGLMRREMDWRSTKGLGEAGSREWSVWAHLCPDLFD